MSFNSLAFFLFALILFPLYWISGHRSQNRILLAASLFFYGFWNPRFLSLLLATILIDFISAEKIASSLNPGRKKFYLALSLCSNLGILGFFKYSGFVQENVARLVTSWNSNAHPWFFDVMLPVGISFYTFQSMSYVIDVYRGRIAPARNVLDFALFVSYFPQLVAGPIERAEHLLPQLQRPRRVTWEHLYEGLWLIVWGLYKKVYVADRLARIVHAAFSKDTGWTGSEVLLALYAFAFQIYGDFSGYSDIARGLAKLMGIELTVNFGTPYLARSPREFWREWHITLSRWLKDYVYIPLGGNRVPEARLYLNLLVTMTIGGLWHGAGWTFILWGLYHGTLLAIDRFFEIRCPFLIPANRSKWVDAIQIGAVFHLVCFGWLFFRSESLAQCTGMIQALFSNFGSVNNHTLFSLFLSLWFLIIVWCTARPLEGGLVVFRWPWWLRGMAYFGAFYSIVIFGVFDGRQFIYFQF